MATQPSRIRAPISGWQYPLPSPYCPSRRSAARTATSCLKLLSRKGTHAGDGSTVALKNKKRMRERTPHASGLRCPRSDSNGDALKGTGPQPAVYTNSTTGAHPPPIIRVGAKTVKCRALCESSKPLVMPDPQQETGQSQVMPSSAFPPRPAPGAGSCLPGSSAARRETQLASALCMEPVAPGRRLQSHPVCSTGPTSKQCKL